jgi:hypothetical protein
MAIFLTCPCHNQLCAQDADAGQLTRCPACGRTLLIPAAGAPQGPAPGVPVSPAAAHQRPRTAAQPAPQRPGSRSVWPLLIAPAVVMLLMAVGLLVYFLNQAEGEPADPEGPGQVAKGPAPDTPPVRDPAKTTETANNPPQQGTAPAGGAGDKPAGAEPDKLVSTPLFTKKLQADQVPDLELAAYTPARELKYYKGLDELPKLTEPRLVGYQEQKLPQLQVQKYVVYNKVVDDFILYDIGRLRGQLGQLALTRFNQLGPDSLPALVRGINLAAGL